MAVNTWKQLSGLPIGTTGLTVKDDPLNPSDAEVPADAATVLERLTLTCPNDLQVSHPIGIVGSRAGGSGPGWQPITLPCGHQSAETWPVASRPRYDLGE